MTVTTVVRKAGAIVAAAMLIGMLAGCVSDMGPTATSQSSGDGPQMRYYGGPKSPMWPAQ
ncbi:hypothetical protein [Streptomyces sp. AcH 505]|uniref:hypothetical protein n=1 Tax=Streptomyces sp. AcH 505 TaxID=352211 RepID=UPI0012FEBBE3